MNITYKIIDQPIKDELLSKNIDDLHNNTFGTDFSLTSILLEKVHDTKYYTAYLNDKLCSMFTTRSFIFKEKNYIKITNGCTENEYRNKGVMRGLFNFFVENNKNINVILDVYKDNHNMLEICNKMKLNILEEDNEKLTFNLSL
jgi:hypothetical protein